MRKATGKSDANDKESWIARTDLLRREARVQEECHEQALCK